MTHHLIRRRLKIRWQDLSLDERWDILARDENATDNIWDQCSQAAGATLTGRKECQMAKLGLGCHSYKQT